MVAMDEIFWLYAIYVVPAILAFIGVLGNRYSESINRWLEREEGQLKAGLKARR